MDINNNMINTSVNDVSTLSNSVNLQALTQTQNIANDERSSFNVDSITNQKRSDLSNTLRNFSSQISQGQSIVSKLQEKSTILNHIRDISNEIVTSKNPEVTANDVQPTIQNNIEKYNSISIDISLNMNNYHEQSDSRTYFDGKLGAKPLSPSEILQAVEEQMSVLNKQKEFVSKELEKIETKALDTIGDEIAKNVASAPFQPIDFGKDIGNFSGANINSVVGSVAVSQANAIPANSPKLLA